MTDEDELGRQASERNPKESPSSTPRRLTRLLSCIICYKKYIMINDGNDDSAAAAAADDDDDDD